MNIEIFVSRGPASASVLEFCIKVNSDKLDTKSCTCKTGDVTHETVTELEYRKLKCQEIRSARLAGCARTIGDASRPARWDGGGGRGEQRGTMCVLTAVSAPTMVGPTAV
eukprot:SAG31_NODE_3929_length_3743_cov_1.472558_3_plen_110_part_00